MGVLQDALRALDAAGDESFYAHAGDRVDDDGRFDSDDPRDVAELTNNIGQEMLDVMEATYGVSGEELMVALLARARERIPIVMAAMGESGFCDHHLEVVARMVTGFTANAVHLGMIIAEQKAAKSG